MPHLLSYSIALYFFKFNTMFTQQEPEDRPIRSNKASTRTGNEKLIIGLLIGGLIGAIVGLYGLGVLPGGYSQAISITTGAFFVVSFLFLLSVIFRERIARLLFTDIHDLDAFQADIKVLIESTAKSISDHVTKPFSEQQQARARKIAPRLANYLIWNKVRNWWFNILVTLFLGIGALTTTVLLVNQNKLLESQNKKVDVQNALIEGQRRSSLVLLMGNVLTDLSNEINRQKVGISADSLRELNSSGYSLSSPLIGRISSLGQGFLPYSLLLGGELTEGEFSPEKAQLLLAVVGSNLDSATLQSVFQRTSFSKSYLAEAKLDYVNLSRADLTSANFKEAHLTEATLNSTTLIKADLSGSDLTGANLTLAFMDSAVINNASLSYADLFAANINGANLSESLLMFANLNVANLNHSKLTNAILYNTVMSGADLNHADFTRANLTKADLSSADFEGAILYDANLSLADLSEANNLSFEQLLSASSLFDTRGIGQWAAALRADRPCLFEKGGCALRGGAGAGILPELEWE